MGITTVFPYNQFRINGKGLFGGKNKDGKEPCHFHEYRGHFIGSLPGPERVILNPALADLAVKYSGVSYTNVLLLSTITSLVVIPFTLLSGAMAGRKIRYKTLILVSIFLISLGVLPFFFDSFRMAIVSRCLVGVGIGISIPFGPALISRFFTGQKRAALQGWVTLVMNLAGVFYQVIAGWVCLIDVNHTWIVHLFALLPLIFILLFFREPESDETAGNDYPDKPDKPDKQAMIPAGKRLPPYVFLTALGYGLMFMFASPVMLNMSSIVVGEKIGTSALAGTIISMYSIGGIISGSVFGFYYKFAGRFAIPFAFLLILAGLAICFASAEPLFLFLGTALFGLGKFSIWPAVMCEYSEMLPEESLTPASSLFVSLLSVGAFLASFSIGLIAELSGNSSPRFPLLVGFFAVIIIAVIWSVYELKER